MPSALNAIRTVALLKKAGIMDEANPWPVYGPPDFGPPRDSRAINGPRAGIDYPQTPKAFSGLSSPAKDYLTSSVAPVDGRKQQARAENAPYDWRGLLASSPWAATGVGALAAGGAAAALSSKKNRIRNMILAALAGGAVGYGSSLLAKRAGRYSDTIGSLTTGAIPYAGAPANAVGGLIGMAETPDTPKEQAEKKDSVLKSFVPGVGSYRTQAVQKAVKGDYEKRNPDKKSAYWSEQFGPLGNIGIMAAGGAGLGLVASLALLMARDKNPENPMSVGQVADVLMAGPVAGSIAGAGTSGLASLGGSLAAALTSTRTKKEQDEAEESGASNYLVPGKASYNAMKRLGHGYARFQEGAK